jgi:hypothetical protein
MDFYKGDFEGLIEFSSAIAENPFGTELLRLAEANYDNIDDAIEDITDGLINAGFEINEELVIGLMVGEQLPTEDLVETLQELCETDSEADRLDASAVASYGIAEELLEAIEAGEFEEDYGDDEEEDEYEGAVGQYEDDEEFDDEEEYDEEPSAQVAALQRQFSRYASAVDEMSQKEAVTEYLDDLSQKAGSLVEGGFMPPSAYHLLFGQDEKSQYVEFSAACDESESTPIERLSNIEFTLAVFEALGPSFEFSSAYEGEEYDGYDESEIETLASQIEASYEMLKQDT